MDKYQTIAGDAAARVVEKKSEFLAFAACTDTEEQAMAFLHDIKAQHRTARHHVFAYRLHEGARERCSDDGEPAKTAGLPVLNALVCAEVTDCTVVVVRYFGGILLGTGGLVRAYGEAAKNCLAAAKKVCISACVRGVWTVEYPLYETAIKLLAENGAQVQTDAIEFADTVTLPFVLQVQNKPPLQAMIRTLCRGNEKIVFQAPFYAPF
ncbi:MAG: YigZ family protein [Ruthenibacterium sp.]